MGLFCSLALSMQFLFLSSLFSSTFTNSLASLEPTHHECHQDESHALLHFKGSFVISKFASYNPFGYPKTVSWTPSTDCCSWDGIECDKVSGHVIGIDLSSSQLYGSINANSSLFSLVHLQSLDLSDNDFNNSQIPASIGEFSHLRYLNLSHFSETTFSGEVPHEVSHLFNLLSLDLRSYIDMHYFPSDPIPTNRLRLNVSTLRGLIQNSTKLEQIRLNFVTISSAVPDILTNLTSLQRLSLFFCELHGEFPVGIFHLPNLISLNLGLNQNLKGTLPDFSGILPASIGNLTSLVWFSISHCNFYGSIPSSLGNLTNLAYLSLEYNNLQGEIPHSLFRLMNLEYLSLYSNSLQGQLELDMFLKLKMLTSLYLSYNKLSLLRGKSSSNLTLPPIQSLGLASCNLSGEFPSWILNLTTLSYLDLQENKLQGEIPHQLFKLENLATLSLTSNLLEGELELDMFLKFKMLNYLGLSNNKLSLLTRKISSNATLPPLEWLDMGSCNLVEFPTVLRDFDQLGYLDVSNNDLKSIPSWIWRKISLQSLNISHDSLTGEISPSICNLKSLVDLDLSYNNLTGMIPSCLGSFSQSLQVLRLKGNKLFGRIPETSMRGSALTMVDFSDNNLQGRLPRALVNCKMLEYLDVSHNQINDSFPFWLGTLPELKVIGLRHNKLNGAIMCSRRCTFPKLHIIDLSHNHFSGKFSPEIVKSWKFMIVSNKSQLGYKDNTLHYKGKGGFSHARYAFTISNKGVATSYEELQRFYYMVAIDVSSNKLSGEIPDVLGDLNSLILLNLSNNLLTGNIPFSLGKLSNLEALDLSLNRLSGRIPQELTNLTFLEFFNVSFNHLSGPIPENNQFSTFANNSFEGNQGLCGIQLTKKCEGGHAKPPTPVASDGDEDSGLGSFFELNWRIILTGYGGGLVAGVALGSTFSADIIQWLKSKSRKWCY